MTILIHPTARLTRRLAGVACGVAFLGISTLSFANGLDLREVTVKYGDLDVSRPEGAIVLYKRIRAAAKEVCSPDYYGFSASIQVDSCIDTSIAQAVAKVNQPALSAVLNAKRGRSPVEHLAANGN
jgi:UrcA family protein